MFAQLWSSLGTEFPALQNLSGLPMAVLVIVSALTLCFFIGYAIKGGQVGWQLWQAVRRVKAISRLGGDVDPADIAAMLTDEPLRHLWDEYADTLHEQTVAVDDDPASGLAIQVRATMPAEAFFTRDALVDSRLFDDFTRHLPGVLTGLGIIGTFAGLLNGLAAFDASTTASAVAGLKPLLDGVAHAFSASAFAIACAMVVTFVSKFCLAIFYRQVEKLNHTIDGLYATGAGEEYLSRLVESSEKAEVHAAELKQALVVDLTQMMNALVERQIQAQIDSNRMLGAQIGEHISSAISSSLGDSLGSTLANTLSSSLSHTLSSSISNSINESLTSGLSASLGDPLRQLAESMRANDHGQHEALGGMIESVLDRSLERMDQSNDKLIEPIREFQQQMDRSMAAMATTQQSLHQLIAEVGHSNAQLANRLDGSLDNAMQASADSQALLLDQMRGFLNEVGKSAATEQASNRQLMEQSVMTVLQQLTQGLNRLETTRRDTAAEDTQRHAELADRTQEIVGSMSTQVEQLVRAVSDQVMMTQRNIDALGAVTMKAIAGMNAGAGNMAAAAQKFETAGGFAASVLEKSAHAADKMAAITGTLDMAARAVHQGFTQYDNTRRTVETNVTALTELVKVIRSEAGLSQRMLTDLERIVAQLKVAESQSQQYLEGVNRTLVRSFEEFGGALTTQLKSTIGDTDRHLTSGVQQLNGVIQHIGLTLSRMKAN